MRNKLKIKKIVFAPAKKVQKYYDEMKELVERLFGHDIDEMFISDKSALYDFLGVNKDVETIKDIIKKINKLYDIDITPVKNFPIVNIIEYMLKRDKYCFGIKPKKGD